MRSMACAASAAFLMLAGPAAAQAERTVQEEAAAVAGNAGDGCDTPALIRLQARKDFRTLEPERRAMVYGLLAICDSDKASEWVRKGSAIAEAPSFVWGLRFLFSAVDGDRKDALRSLETAAERAGDGTLNLFIDEVVLRFARGAEDSPREFERIMQALERADWKGVHYGVGDDLWRLHAERRMAAEDPVGARRATHRIVGPRALAEISLDKRFAGVIAADTWRYDIGLAAEASLKAHREAYTQNPSDENVQGLSNDLRVLGRLDEALKIVSEALARPAEASDERNWVVNEKAMVLYALGRFDEALAIMRSAAKLDEQGQPNVSQTINLAGLLNGVGRPSEALEVLKPFEGDALQASPYGWMWVHAERACAYAVLGQAEKLKAELAFTASKEADNPAAAAKAQLCAADDAAVAAIYIRRLRSPDQRGAALFELSQFKSGPKPVLEATLGERFQRVRARPELKAAVAEVGRMGDFPLYGAALVDFY